MANGEGALTDSGLYGGDVYDEELGLTAAGDGASGSSMCGCSGESSGRLMIPACAARKSP
jgi:hypothetical protein